MGVWHGSPGTTVPLVSGDQDVLYALLRDGVDELVEFPRVLTHGLFGDSVIRAEVRQALVTVSRRWYRSKFPGVLPEHG